MAEPSTILVVEDDPVILDLLAVNFELEGYTVVRAVDGEDGLATRPGGSGPGSSSPTS